MSCQNFPSCPAAATFCRPQLAVHCLITFLYAFVVLHLPLIFPLDRSPLSSSSPSSPLLSLLIRFLAPSITLLPLSSSYFSHLVCFHIFLFLCPHPLCRVLVGCGGSCGVTCRPSPRPARRLQWATRSGLWVWAPPPSARQHLAGCTGVFPGQVPSTTRVAPLPSFAPPSRSSLPAD